jgi:AraC-like DNA-binding protein
MLSDVRHAGTKISTIAFDAGFNDLSSFYRAFRRRFGALPSEIRAQCGGVGVRRDPAVRGGTTQKRRGTSAAP